MTMADIETRLNTLEQELATLRREVERQRVREGIRKGLEQVERGEVLPAREVLEAMRKKYNIQPS